MNKPAGKTPYEIRLELLQLANQILMARYESNIKLPVTGNASYSFMAPTSEEVIAEADKLNAFISKANPTGRG